MKRFQCSILFLALSLTSCEKIDDIFGDGTIKIDKEPIESEHVEYMAIFGDIQYYTDNDRMANKYQGTLEWIETQQSYGVVFDCILHTGDITNTNSPEAYKRFYKKTNQLASKIPFYSAIGDHDYLWNGAQIVSRDSTHFSEYTSFSLNKSHILSAFEQGRNENVIYSNSVNGFPLYIVCLEFGPRHDVVDWADQYVKAHSNENFIVLTHEYLEKGGGL